jgi:hypothetical protein
MYQVNKEIKKPEARKREDANLFLSSLFKVIYWIEQNKKYCLLLLRKAIQM